MKNGIFNFFVIVMSGALIVSCSSDGAMGPEGSQGPQGQVGIPGDDGNMLYAGNNAPHTAIGKDGDFYIDMQNSNIYGPKASGSWGSPSSTKGDKGDNGNDGSQFLSGTTNPNSTLGKVGDFYFNLSTATIFGPKTTSGWNAGTYLKGPKGDKGDKGDDGNANVTSRGWKKIPLRYWSRSGGYKSPMDISTPFITNSALSISNGDSKGLVMVYVRGLDSGGRVEDVNVLPVMAKVNGGGKNGGIELRFSHHSDPNYAIYIDISVGLQKGEWDLTYMETYLTNLEFKVVTIPVWATSLSDLDLTSYDAVQEFFDFKD